MMNEKSNDLLIELNKELSEVEAKISYENDNLVKTSTEVESPLT